MLRTLARAAAAAGLLAAASPVLAQAPAPRSTTRVGFGVGVEPLHFSTIAPAIAVPAVGIYLPIQIGSTLRIEPSLALSTYSQGTAAAQASGPLSSSSLVLGVGGHYYIVPPSPVGLYLGGRLALAFESTRDVAGGGATVQTSAASFTVAGVLGGEYFVHHAFSVGAEAQLGLTALGDLDVETNGVTTTLARRGALATNGVVYLRYFF